MNNKSNKYEYRIMHTSDDSWAYYIEFRSLSFLGKLLGWCKYCEHNARPKYAKTFYGLEDAKSYVEALIAYDNKQNKKTIIKQVWPEDDNLINHY